MAELTEQIRLALEMLSSGHCESRTVQPELVRRNSVTAPDS